MSNIRLTVGSLDASREPTPLGAATPSASRSSPASMTFPARPAVPVAGQSRRLVALFLALAAFASGRAPGALAGEVIFNYDKTTIQTSTVPTTGTYTITADGAQGGSIAQGAVGGLGAEVSGTVTLTAGTTLDIVVGGQGNDFEDLVGGGGGSFVYAQTGDSLLLVAGGGGGAFDGVGGAGQSSTSGQDGLGGGGGAGGTNGNGGQAPALGSEGGGGGGGGWASVGGNASDGRIRRRRSEHRVPWR